MRTAPKATRRAASARQLPVPCFYCDERFRRSQERATHIRHYHPGKPYRPDLEQAHEEPAANVAPCAAAPVAPPEAGSPETDPLTPKQHLVAAITAIKRRQQMIDEQAPELEKQLEALRATQKQMDGDLQALETALAAIGGTVLEQVQKGTGTPAQAGK